MARGELKSPKEGLGDGLMNLLDGLARFLFYIGLLAGLIGVGFLIYTYMQSSNAPADKVLQNIQTFSKVGIIGMLAGALGAAWVFWGEETVGPLILIVAAAMYTAPFYMPAMAPTASAEGEGAITAVAQSAYGPAAVAIFVIILEVTARLRLRAMQGAKAETMKYGRGLKEERDVRNVFLGKCWQLPYCRKFVRERCPIYHARRTCWKERVGCMCEESVIRNAMEGKVIPSDMVAAAKFIPKNSKLTPSQKAERCRQCVIYNEHQKHKYKLYVASAFGGIGATYILIREPAGEQIKKVLMRADSSLDDITLSQGEENTPDPEAKVTSIDQGVIPYHEIMLVVLAVVALAYAIRLIEWATFRMKA